MKSYQIIGITGLVILLGICARIDAYEYVGDNANCQKCHEEFSKSINTTWHEDHKIWAAYKCDQCHDENQNVPTSNCGNCHIDLPCSWVSVHKTKSPGTCDTCHSTCSISPTTVPATTTTSVPVTTTTTAREGLCPARKALGDDSPDLAAIYSFRDTALKSSPQGSWCAAIYYKHASEITSILSARPELEESVRRFIKSILPALSFRANGQAGTIKAESLAEALSIIDTLSASGSIDLKRDLGIIRHQMKSGKLLEALGIKIE